MKRIEPIAFAIETPRLRLRRFASADLAALLAYRRDPEVAKYQSFSPDYTSKQGRGFIADVQHAELGGEAWVNLAVELRASGATIGDVGIHRAGDGAEIGFTFARAYQGYGYAREAVGAMAAYAFDAFPYARLEATIDARNNRAAHLLIALQFAVSRVSVGVVFKGALCEELCFVRMR
jgi:RimJ/RimL family protein N-acetyltransferase